MPDPSALAVLDHLLATSAHLLAVLGVAVDLATRCVALVAVARADRDE